MMKMDKQQAIEYLEKVLENWNSWRDHHEPLCKAIEVLLEEININEDRNNRCRDYRQEKT